MTEPRVPDIPALRIFDAKATRWAVIRGLLRTALVVLGLFLVGSFLLGLATHVLSSALGRQDQLQRMVVAYKVAHPGFQVTEEHSRTGSWHQTASLSGRANEGETQDVRLSLNMLGALDVRDRRDDPVDGVLDGASWPKTSTELFLKRLPAGVTVDGVVVFGAPVHLAGDVLPDNDWQGAEAVFYSPPFPAAFGETELSRQPGQQRPVTWGMGGYPFDSFPDWATHLTSRDDDNLDRLGLPPSRVLKELAAKGDATGFYIRGLPPAAVARLLHDRRIASFTPSAVQYDLSMPQ
jgi:hypothetical protein